MIGRYHPFMPSPAGLRDSTQIVVAHGVLDGIRGELEAEFSYGRA
jgi:hypothetical protein